MNNDIIKVSRNTPAAPKNVVATHSVAFSHYNNISAQLALDPQTGKMVTGGIKEQTNQCLANIKAIVESIDHDMNDVVKINIFLADIADIDAVDNEYKRYFPHYLPTRSVVAVANLPINNALIQIDAVISNGEGTAPQAPCPLVKMARNTAKAPQHSLSTQTVAFSHYNNISAQLPIDPLTGQLVQGGISEQTTQCLTNINAILSSIDHVMDDVVKTTISVKNLADMDAVNTVLGQFYPHYVPARTIVNVSALPMDALIQIDTVVSHGDGTPPQLPQDSRLLVIEANNTENAPTVNYSHTVAFSHYNHISGQLPLDPNTAKIVSGGVNDQARQCLNNIKAIVESIDHHMDDIVKINIQVSNIADMDAVDDVYTTFFDGTLPARTTIGVAAIPMGALVQIDAVVSNCESTPPQS